MTYPNEITEAELKRQAHIPDQEVLADIASAELEAKAYRLIGEGYFILQGLPENAGGESARCRFQSQAFFERMRQVHLQIDYLNKLIEARKKQNGA